MNASAESSIGGRIRTLRRRQQRLLRDVAGQCGFTVSLLSKIEAGKTSPPIATLTKIAAALGVTLSELVAEPRELAAVLTRADAAPLTRTDKGYAFRMLAAARGGKRMQPFYFVATRRGVRPGAMTHAGEEFVHVLSGRMRYRVGATTYTLGPGDSLYFDAVEEHDLEPITKAVEFLAVFTADESRPRKKEKR